MYIDENCFLPLKMEELFTIAVSLGEIVHNRGFSPVALPGRELGRGKLSVKDHNCFYTSWFCFYDRKSKRDN